MITRPQVLMQVVCYVLILMFVPGLMSAQEQKEPGAPQPGKPAENTAAQQPAAAPAPAQGEPQAAPSGATASPIASEGSAPSRVPAPADQPYTIRQGDTLWDISNSFLKDPFLWPFIWKANPSITNPDLIFAGNKLTIPSLTPIERALQAEEPRSEPVVEKQQPMQEEVAKTAPPVEEPMPAQEVRSTEGIAAAGVLKPKKYQASTGEEPLTEGNRFIAPEEQAPPLIDKYAMLSAGYVKEEEKEGLIVGMYENTKTVASYDELVFVEMNSGTNANIGDKFLIYAPLDKVKHPTTGASLGRLIKGLGIVKIIAKDSPTVLTARVTLSFGEIEKGALLTPYLEPALLFGSPGKKAKDVSGYIVAVRDHRTVNAQSDIVYLDKGSLDGVEPGDLFTVYTKPQKRDFPRQAVGEVLVILTKDHTATAIVRKSTNTMARGDMIDYKK